MSGPLCTEVPCCCLGCRQRALCPLAQVGVAPGAGLGVGGAVDGGGWAGGGGGEVGGGGWGWGSGSEVASPQQALRESSLGPDFDSSFAAKSRLLFL